MDKNPFGSMLDWRNRLSMMAEQSRTLLYEAQESVRAARRLLDDEPVALKDPLPEYWERRKALL
jgi:hypothetical protein